ncbi:DUF5105 domain-containing protein [Pseudobacillus badius]|uniref:DUF5105 domain-containing protein n=1 Tax=Bacillus badius TaxID=1455 RepID=UPI0007B0B8BB|nr:DUF5105 domain-containing protein [Bacillus badius]KZN98503.1 hypothetical protein A4244_09325 [Bacillus badius]MED0666160.1 DUF5105 domain-containing protein [Bacillus badius]OCS83201.1 hypothetical protein A6M11_09335 [Bacillus badius]OVE51577.1 hypothetical protein B1A98_11060 [Bacillus badius]TDW02819.1 uncharacterized protein DUF4352 [Bacillus badius]
MNKKIGIFAFMLSIMLVLAACGGSGTKEASGETGKSKVAEVSIDKAEFILAGDDGEAEEETAGMLLVDLKVKNDSKSSINVSSYDGVYLYDGDEQLSPETSVYARGIDLETEGSSDIGAGKVKTIPLYFNAEKDKKYKIGVTPRLSKPGEEAEEIMLELDTKKYAKSFNELQDPAKALTAYIDVIYLGKDNEDYEKLVTADKEAVQEEAKTGFKKQLDLSLPDATTDADIDKYYNSYKSALGEKATVEAKTTAKAGDKAVVKLDYSTVSTNKLYDKLYDYQKEYRTNTGGFDTEKEKQYALSKFDAAVQSLEVAKSQHGAEIKMVKKDGKWTVDTSDHYADYLVQAFGEGKAY